MAFVMARNTRQSLQSGVYTPVKSFNTVARRQNKRPLDWQVDRAGFYGLMRCFALETTRSTASYAYYPQKLTPTILTKLIGPEPKQAN